MIIMEFMDEHIGKYYTGRELKVIFRGQFSPVSLYRKLNQIVKRDEYVCILGHRPNCRKLTAVYGREKE